MDPILCDKTHASVLTAQSMWPVHVGCRWSLSPTVPRFLPGACGYVFALARTFTAIARAGYPECQRLMLS